MSEHIVKAFDEDIDKLRGHIAEMGGRAEASINTAIKALVKRDHALARQVIEDDKAIDELEAMVEKLAIKIIALRAPMAADLREVVGAFKIAGEIERIGDYSKNIARGVILMEGRDKIGPQSLVPAMGEVAAEMVSEVLNAFSKRDAEAALRVCERDAAVDDFYNTIFRALVTFMMENPQTISNAAQLLFIARNLERIGDHATNVAEMVYFAATGNYLDDRDRIVEPSAADAG